MPSRVSFSVLCKSNNCCPDSEHSRLQTYCCTWTIDFGSNNRSIFRFMFRSKEAIINSNWALPPIHAFGNLDSLFHHKQHHDFRFSLFLKSSSTSTSIDAMWSTIYIFINFYDLEIQQKFVNKLLCLNELTVCFVIIQSQLSLLFFFN